MQSHLDEPLQRSGTSVDLDVSNVGKKVSLNVWAAQGMHLSKLLWESYAQAPHDCQVLLHHAGIVQGMTEATCKLIYEKKRGTEVMMSSLLSTENLRGHAGVIQFTLVKSIRVWV